MTEESMVSTAAICSCADYLKPIQLELEKLAKKGGTTSRLNQPQVKYLTSCLITDEGEVRYHAKCITEHLGLAPKRIRRLKAKVPVADKAAAQKTPAPVDWPLEKEFTNSDVQWLLDVNDKIFESLHHCISAGKAQDGLAFTKALVNNILDLAAHSEKPDEPVPSDTAANT